MSIKLSQFLVLTCLALVLALNGRMILATSLANWGYIDIVRGYASLPSSAQMGPFVQFQGSKSVNLERGIEYLEKSGEIANNPNFEYGLGIAYFADGDYLNAETSWAKSLHTHRPLAGIFLGYALLRQGKSLEAFNFWESIPEAPAALRQQARLLLAAGAVSRSVEIYSWITRLEPNSVTAWLDLAEAYQGLGDWQEVAMCYDRVAALEPANPGTSFRQAEIAYHLHHDAAAARDILEPAMTRLRIINSFDDEFRLYRTYGLMADISQSQGLFDEAIEWEKQAMGLPHITHRQSMARIAFIYQIENEPDHARAWMDLAISEAPNDYSMHEALGNLLVMQADISGARTAFEKATHLAPVVISPHLALANILQQLGDMRGAEREFKAVLKIDQQNADASAGLRRLKTSAP